MTHSPGNFILPAAGAVNGMFSSTPLPTSGTSHRDPAHESKGQLARVLLEDVSGPQAVREMETDNRPQSPKHLHPEFPLQDGDASIHQVKPGLVWLGNMGSSNKLHWSLLNLLIFKGIATWIILEYG